MQKTVMSLALGSGVKRRRFRVIQMARHNFVFQRYRHSIQKWEVVAEAQTLKALRAKVPKPLRIGLQ